MAEQPYVELRNIRKQFGGFTASDDVSFSIEKGKLIGLLGPSGSGKTTILRILAGLETADAGEIYIDGKQVNRVPAAERRIGFVFQNYALFRYKTVYENIAFGMKIQKYKKADIKARVDELTELVGLQGLEKRYPRQLSGGQRQRVAFARALATQPQLLLLDEPFAAIDAKVRKELRSWLRELISRVGITSIFVTHDQEEAIEVADEIIITNRGRIEQIGSPADIYYHPRTAFVAQFLGQPTVIEDYRRLKAFGEAAAGSGGESAKALLRPEFVTVYQAGEAVPYPVSTERGIVRRASFRGSFLKLEIDVAGTRITANRQLWQPLIREGEEVGVLVQRLYLVTPNADGSEGVRMEVNPALRQESWII